ncbi:MAG: hypothetical protein HY852_23375 [Bradyrhizobium sp.]|uniref:hypothetical protein n=1 Tax=Bradyrhizobium sp. TaxID=376 RepID=UPI0025C4528E|nr:hypothetical protein [Bradyrhizobium sp.]MBI5264748.1 hypothetical protein [Bradyrhizobium sp.]
MSAAGNASGSGSALIGVLQFGYAFAASGVVSKTQNGTAFPMTLTILGCAALASLTSLLFRFMQQQGRFRRRVTMPPR